MKKRSEQIRSNIGALMYEQQLFQNAGNDLGVDKTEERINTLRSQLLSVEEEEKSNQNENEDHG